MASTYDTKVERRQISAEFKERKVPRGIYAIGCAPTGEVWVNSSPNLNAAQNSLWFQLRGGLARHPDLQAAWNQHGEQSFAFEILERFEDETAPLLLDDLYATKKREWANILDAQVL